MARRITHIREKRFETLAVLLQIVTFRQQSSEGARLFVHVVCQLSKLWPKTDSRN